MNSKKMIEYIQNHVKHYVRCDKCIANNIKVYKMNFDGKTEDFVYDALINGLLWDYIRPLIDDAEYDIQAIDKNVKIYSAGRSDGWLVLYGIDDEFVNYPCADNEYSTIYITNMYKIVKRFDALRVEIKKECIALAKQYTITDATIQVEKKVKILVEK